MTTRDELRQLQELAKSALLRGPYEKLAWEPRPKGKPVKKEYVTPELPLSKRFEGMWVVGSQGSGKTQFFKRQAKLDLDMVAAGKASMFILDPTGDQPEVREDGQLIESATLIHSITRLKRFARGGDLHRKLVYINPEDRDWYTPINLFGINADTSDDDAVDSVADSYVSIINGLLGQKLTQFQDPVLRHAILATMELPNPSLATLREVLAVYPPATAKYSPPLPIYHSILHKLHPDLQVYFRTSYDSQRDTRNAVLARLASLTASAKFRRIFTASKIKMKLNFSDLINEPKVIVINASRDYLGALKELYGRFFISLLKRAGEARPSGSIPCFAYVDECDEFLREDQYAGQIIFKLRRKRVGLMLGNQATSQIKEDDARAAFFSTAIKMVNVNETNSAKEIAEALNLKDGGRYATDEFMGRKAFDFAYYVRGVTDEPISLRFKPGVLEAEPMMTESEWRETYNEIRREYYEPVTRAEPSAPLSAEEPPLPFSEPALPPTPEVEQPIAPDDETPTPRTRREF